MKTLSATELAQAKLDPASVFHAPKEVLETQCLSREDKKEILVRWEADAEALIRATEEGMPPEDNRRSPAELLRAVQEAIEALGPKA
jgi:hypothetical protein